MSDAFTDIPPAPKSEKAMVGEVASIPIDPTYSSPEEEIEELRDEINQLNNQIEDLRAELVGWEDHSCNEDADHDYCMPREDVEHIVEQIQDLVTDLYRL